MKLHWVCRQPTPYNDYLFGNLAAAGELDLTVHFVESSLSSHPWQVKMAEGFNSRTYQTVLGLDWHILRTAFSDDCFFLIGGWNEPTMISLINLLIARGQPFAIWTDTPNLIARRNAVKSWLRERWLREVFNHCRYVLGTGEIALAHLRAMHCPPDKLVNFPFYIDLNIFSPSAPAPSRDCFQFISSGRLVNDHKGFDIAIRALGAVKKRRPGLKFTYKIAGTGRDEQPLRALAAALDLKDEVEFCGWVEPRTLADLYRAGHVFLHPSHFDPYPVAVLEAMASAMIVIGSDQAGSAVDRIKDSFNGFIHRADDADSLADKIDLVISRYDELASIRLEARRTAEAWPVERAISIIQGILDLPQRHRELTIIGK